MDGQGGRFRLGDPGSSADASPHEIILLSGLVGAFLGAGMTFIA